MTLLRDIVRYVRRPYFYPEREALNGQSAIILLQLYVLNFFGIMGAAFLAGFIFVSFGSTFPETEAEFEKLLVPENIFLIAVAVPFIEELIYRSWLGWRWGVTILMPIVLIPTTFALIQASEGQVNQGFISLTLIALMIYFTLLFRRMSEPGFLESFTQRLFPVAFLGHNARLCPDPFRKL